MIQVSLTVNETRMILTAKKDKLTISMYKMKHYFVIVLLITSLFSKAQQPFIFCEKQVNQVNYSQITIPDAKVFFKSIPKIKQSHIEYKPMGGVPGSYTDLQMIAYKKEGVVFHFMKGNTAGYASEDYVLRIISISKKSSAIQTCDGFRIGDLVTLNTLGLTLDDYIRDITMKAKYGSFTKNGIKYSVVIATKGKLTTDSQLKIKRIIIDFR